MFAWSILVRRGHPSGCRVILFALGRTESDKSFRIPPDFLPGSTYRSQAGRRLGSNMASDSGFRVRPTPRSSVLAPEREQSSFPRRRFLSRVIPALPPWTEQSHDTQNKTAAIVGHPDPRRIG